MSSAEEDAASSDDQVYTAGDGNEDYDEDFLPDEEDAGSSDGKVYIYAESDEDDDEDFFPDEMEGPDGEPEDQPGEADQTTAAVSETRAAKKAKRPAVYDDQTGCIINPAGRETAIRKDEKKHAANPDVLHTRGPDRLKQLQARSKEEREAREQKKDTA